MNAVMQLGGELVDAKDTMRFYPLFPSRAQGAKNVPNILIASCLARAAFSEHTTVVRMLQCDARDALARGPYAPNGADACRKNKRCHGLRALRIHVLRSKISCKKYTWPGSNWRPSACEADVIATRPQVQVLLETHAPLNQAADGSPNEANGRLHSSFLNTSNSPQPLHL